MPIPTDGGGGGAQAIDYGQARDYSDRWWDLGHNSGQQAGCSNNSIIIAPFINFGCFQPLSNLSDVCK